MVKVNPQSPSSDSNLMQAEPSASNDSGREKKVPKGVSKKVKKKGSALTPKRLNTSIKFDGIHPADYLKYDLRLSCEDCTHYHHEAETCTLGYVTQWHRKAFQEYSYELMGKVALCRFQEID